MLRDWNNESEGSVGEDPPVYSIKEIINLEKLREIFEAFSKATGFTTGFVSYPGQELLISTGWRDICTKFHRTTHESLRHCKDSNMELTEKLKNLKETNILPCGNGLVDGATPLIVNGIHLASLATGQVFFEKPDIEWFNEHGKALGYDMERYLRAVDEVPVVSENQFREVLAFLSELASFIVEYGIANLRLKEYTIKLEKEITERLRAEEALKESQSRFISLFTSMNEGVALHRIIQNEEGIPVDYRILVVNPAFERITGIPKEEAVGKYASELYGTGNPPYLNEYSKAALTGEPASMEVFFEPLGKHFRISVSSPEKGIFATIFEDITRRKKEQDELRRLNDELEKMVEERTEELMLVNRELESFSYAVSHDLRSPLRSIDGFATILLEEYRDRLDETGKDYFLRIQKASKSMGQIIEDLLSLSRVTRGTPLLNTVYLSDLVKTIAEELKKKDPHRHAQFIIEKDLTAQGDHRLFPIAIENLLDNAWKFTEKKPEALIEFGKTLKDGKTTYFIRDNGAGFDQSQAHRLFNPFQRLHSQDEYKGSGVGLSTVKRVIQRHGGRIWAEGKTGEGAVFYFTLNEKHEALNKAHQ
ncbi:MAG: PocR ligand-binding domain-containing protein [Candidatus Eremiobacteraeota bacterium]|nr:PocR ligand-binding domain-containing protein [Candidatus Eremiobacteraeota bacterium]